MLSDLRFKGGWRKLTTLSRVIGANETTTTRVLIEIGARGSEKDDALWGLIENHPFNETDQQAPSLAPHPRVVINMLSLNTTQPTFAKKKLSNRQKRKFANWSASIMRSIFGFRPL